MRATVITFVNPAVAVVPGMVILREEVTLLSGEPGEPAKDTRTGELVTLDPMTRRQRSRFPLTYGRGSTTWALGFVYPASGFVAVERLTEPVDPAAEDSGYYLAAQPVILAAT